MFRDEKYVYSYTLNILKKHYNLYSARPLGSTSIYNLEYYLDTKKMRAIIIPHFIRSHIRHLILFCCIICRKELGYDY